MNNQLIISNTSIRKDSIGRYSLNDLHKASGGKKRHQPSDWLRLEQTNELIAEILKPEITGIKTKKDLKIENPTIEPVYSKSGRYGGTYVCKELVYSYAMWISAAFALKVIRAYDNLVTTAAKVKATFVQSTAKELTPLRQTAERLIATGVGNIYPDIWKYVHKEFGVEHINELLPEQIPQAISYLDALEGEYIPKQTGRFVGCHVLHHYDDKGTIVKSEIAADDEQLTSPKVFADLAESRGYVMVKKDEIGDSAISKMNVNALHSHIIGIQQLYIDNIRPSLQALKSSLEVTMTERIITAPGLVKSLQNDVNKVIAK